MLDFLFYKCIKYFNISIDEQPVACNLLYLYNKDNQDGCKK